MPSTEVAGAASGRGAADADGDWLADRGPPGLPEAAGAPADEACTLVDGDGSTDGTTDAGATDADGADVDEGLAVRVAEADGLAAAGDRLGLGAVVAVAVGRAVVVTVGVGVFVGVAAAVGRGVGRGVARGVAVAVATGVGLGERVGDAVGRGVGFGVGAGVGFGVGRGVGRGVGVGCGAPLTTTTPVIAGWISQ